MKNNRFSLIVALAAALLSGAAARAQQQEIVTVEIGQLSVTHILFTSDLTYVNVASPTVIRAKVVESSKNMLALQALSEFAYQTTISALEANGTMHTFYVRYNSSPKALLLDTRTGSEGSSGNMNTQIRPDQQGQMASSGSVSSSVKDEPSASAPAGRSGRKGSESSGVSVTQPSGNGVNVTSTETSNFGRGNAPTIEEVMRKGRNLYHITDKCYGIEADCINVYAYSDQIYLVLSLTNKSDIGYDAGDAQFTVETKKVSSKTLQSDKPVWAKSSYGKLACAPNSMTKIGYTIPKLTLQKNEILKVYIYEKDGTRNLFLTLDAKDINYAVSPI